jgi:hypothetical protein
MAFSPPRFSAGMAAYLQPLDRRLFFLAAGARHLAPTKWFVPGGFEVSSGDGATPERGVRALAPYSSVAMP